MGIDIDDIETEALIHALARAANIDPEEAVHLAVKAELERRLAERSFSERTNG